MYVSFCFLCGNSDCKAFSETVVGTTVVAFAVYATLQHTKALGSFLAFSYWLVPSALDSNPENSAQLSEFWLQLLFLISAAFVSQEHLNHRMV